MKPEEAFGAVLKNLRKKRAITQEELALNCDLDRTFISMLERGQRQPSLTTILQISSALNYPASELVKLTVQAISIESKEYDK